MFGSAAIVATQVTLSKEFKFVQIVDMGNAVTARFIRLKGAYTARW